MGPWQVNAQGQGMLESLEKAHIDIEQLKVESDHKGEQVMVLTREVTAFKANESQLEHAHRDIDQLHGDVTAFKTLIHLLMVQNRDAAPGEEG